MKSKKIVITYCTNKPQNKQLTSFILLFVYLNIYLILITMSCNIILKNIHYYLLPLNIILN